MLLKKRTLHVKTRGYLFILGKEKENKNNIPFLFEMLPSDEYRRLEYVIESAKPYNMYMKNNGNAGSDAFGLSFLSISLPYMYYNTYKHCIVLQSSVE